MPVMLRARALLLLLVWAVVTWAGPARAEVGTETVSSGVRGTIGGLVLGAETAMLIEAGFGVKPLWGYAIGAAVGGTAGALGGYALDEAGQAGAGMALLAVGLLVAVPTTILVLERTRYHEPPPDGVPIEGAEVGRRRAFAAHRATLPPNGPLPLTSFLAEYDGEKLALRVPAVEISWLSLAPTGEAHAVGSVPRLLVPLFFARF